MSPYREAPHREPPGPLPPELRRWQEARQRLERIQGAAWSAPSLPCIDRAAVVEVSGDGKTILVLGKQSWLIKAATLQAWPLGPGDVPPKVALNDRGTRAAFVYDGQLELWDLPDHGGGEPRRRRVLPRGVRGTRVSMSADGALVAHAADSETATVYIVDWALGQVIYSFTGDCDEGMLMHPAGDLVFCWQDNHNLRAVGRNGGAGQIPKGCGLAVARDGETVAFLDYDARDIVWLGRITSRAPLEIVKQRKLKLDGVAEWYEPFLRFSPSAEHLLVYTDRYNVNGVTRVRLSDGEARFIELESQLRYPIAGGFLAGEERLLLGRATGETLDFRGLGLAAALVETASARFIGGLGVVGVQDQEQRQLVGVTDALIHGQLLDPPQPLTGEQPALPYERPGLIRQLLLGQQADWPEGDALKLEDTQARWTALHQRRREFVRGTALDPLVDATTGLTHLIPEALHRALALAEELPRFGAPMLTGAAVASACEELQGLGRVERGEVYEQMLARLQATRNGLKPAAPVTAQSRHPSLPSLAAALAPGDEPPPPSAVRELEEPEEEPAGDPEQEQPTPARSSVAWWLILTAALAAAVGLYLLAT